MVIAPGHGAAYPLRITGFSLQYNMPTQPAPDAVLSIVSVRGAATMTGRFGAPFAAAVPGGRMRFATTAGSGQVNVEPAVSAATVHGTTLSVAFDPGRASPRPSSGRGPPHCRRR